MTDHVLPLGQWWRCHRQWAGHQGWPLSPRRDKWCWSPRRRNLACTASLPSTHTQRMGWMLTICGREGWGGWGGADKKTKDGLMNVCEHVTCATRHRDSKTESWYHTLTENSSLLTGEWHERQHGKVGALKSVNHLVTSDFQIPRWLSTPHIATTNRETGRRRGERHRQTWRWAWQRRIKMRKEEIISEHVTHIYNTCAKRRQ